MSQFIFAVVLCALLMPVVGLSIDVKPDVGTSLLRIKKGEVVLYDPWLEYAFSTGHVPCKRGGCDLNLFSYGPKGVEKVQLSQIQRKKIDLCGSDAEKVIAKAKIENPSFFVTSIDPSRKEAVYVEAIESPTQLTVENLKDSLPKWFNPKLKHTLKTYMYPGGLGWRYVVSLTARRNVEGDVSEGEKNGWIDDTHFFVANEKESKILTPDDIYKERFYGKVTTFMGTVEMGKSPRTELLFGHKGQVNFIVLGRKLNHIVFPFMPPKGC